MVFPDNEQFVENIRVNDFGCKSPFLNEYILDSIDYEFDYLGRN
jgi:hypothetical protein